MIAKISALSIFLRESNAVSVNREKGFVARTVPYLLSVLLTSCVCPAHCAQGESGKTLVDRQGCKNCHVVEGTGSFLAPPLDGLPRSKEEIIVKLTQSKPQKRLPYALPAELMSHVHVSKADAKLIADYLSTLPDNKIETKGHGTLPGIPEQSPAGAHFVAQPKSASSERGALLYKDKGCIACHAVGSIGGTAGPNFAGVGARRSRNFIMSRIATGAVFLPKPGQSSSGFTMPPSKLSEQEIEDLTNWLMTLPPAK